MGLRLMAFLRLGSEPRSCITVNLSQPPKAGLDAALCGAANTQGLFFFGFHAYMMQDCPATKWSIVTSVSHQPTEDLLDPRPVWSILTSLQVHSC
jgi:hypothetical protein